LVQSAELARGGIAGWIVVAVGAGYSGDGSVTDDSSSLNLSEPGRVILCSYVGKGRKDCQNEGR